MGRATSRGTAWLTTRRLLVALLFVAIFAMAVRQPADTDTWWHLKSGQVMWETGRLLRADPFSHTVNGQPILYPALFQLLLWPIYHLAGLGGLALLVAATVTAAFALVYSQCPGKPYLAAFATLLATVTSSVIWAARPQILSFLLTALVAYLLHRYKQSGHSRWLWPIPLLMIVWVNGHGGFVVGFILLGCYLVGGVLDRLTGSPQPAGLRPLLVVTLVSVPAILLNPHTIKMIPYALQTISIGPLQDFIQEWAAPDFHDVRFHPFIWLILLLLAALGLSRRRVAWTDLALVGVFGYMGLLAVRNIALFALVAPPVLARHAVAALDNLVEQAPHLSWLAVLAPSRPSPRPRRPQLILNALLLLLLLTGAGAKVGLELIRLPDPAVWGQGLPLGAIEYLRDHDLPGEMFNTYNWGGYLLWSLYPERLVFVDGRTDLYALNGTVLQDYARVHWVRPGWQQVLDRYQIGFVVTEQSGLLDEMLAMTGGWTPAHRDGTAVIYTRTEAGP